MKIWSLVILISNLISPQLPNAQAVKGSDPEAQELLASLSSKIGNLKSMKVKFNLTTEFAEENPVVQEGEFCKSGRKFNLTADEYVMITDGIVLWTYFKNINEVHISNYEENEMAMMASPEQFLRIHESDDFLYAIMDKKTVQGRSLTIIEFKPTDPQSPYSKIRMSVDARKHEPVVIETFVKDGSRYHLHLTEFISEPSLENSLFKFNPSAYPGIHIEDLRH